MGRGTIHVALAGLLFAGAASAQTSSRTWVSNTGSDLNPCTIVRPCATFLGALGKTAAGGEIDALNAGEYGPFGFIHPITQAVTIDGMGVATITGNVSIAAGPTDEVVLRNLSIAAPTDCVDANGGMVTLQNLSMSGCNAGVFASAGTVNVQDTRIANVQNGVDFYAGNGTLKNVFVANAAANGIKLAGSGNADVKVYSSTFVNTATGAYVQPTTSYTDTLTVRESSFQGVTGGIEVLGGGTVNLTKTVVTSPGVSLSCDSALGSAIVTFGGNQINGSTSCTGLGNGFTATGTLQ